MENKIYLIDHVYDINHLEQCLLIKSNIDPEKLIQILSSIQFKFEELIDETVSVDEEHILRILKDFYNVENIKSLHLQELEELLNDENEFNFDEAYIDGEEVIFIDLYFARESCCGEFVYDLMDEVLPKDEKFIEYIKSLNDFYTRCD